MILVFIFPNFSGRIRLFTRPPLGFPCPSKVVLGTLKANCVCHYSHFTRSFRAFLVYTMEGMASMMSMKFDNTLGALLVGGLCATALYGVTCVQVYNYFVRGCKDTLKFQLMIAFLWALDTFDAVLNGHFLYFYLVANYLNPLAIMQVAWSVIAHVAATSISNFIIRTMFAKRVWALSNGNIPLTVLIMLVSGADLVVGLVITGRACQINSFLELESLSSLMYTNFAVGTGSDMLVALSLCYYLWRSHGDSLQRTKSVLQVLMIYTINTGLLVALDAAAGMITYIVMPHNFIFLGFYLLLSKLYLNSYLAALNARSSLRKVMDEPVSIHLSQLSNARRFGMESSLSSPASQGTDKRSDTVAISVSTLIDRKYESDGDIEFSHNHSQHSQVENGPMAV